MSVAYQPDWRRREPADIDHMPHSFEAEHAVLGILLYDNSAIERVDEILKGEHFAGPFHGRLYEAITRLARKGTLADPIVLNDRFKEDAEYLELGDIRFLADLVDRAPSAAYAVDYARTVRDMAIRRALIRVGEEVARDARRGDTDLTAREQVEAAEQRLYELGEKGAAQGGPRSFTDSLAGAIEMAAEAYHRDGKLAGLSTGLVDLDSRLGGLRPSGLIIVAARPSMGKTALGLNIAFDVAKRYRWEPRPDGSRKTVSGGVVGFWSLEMSAEELSLRVLAEVSGVPSDKIVKGEITAPEFGKLTEAAGLIQESPLHIDDTGGLSIGKLAARARRLKRTVGLDLIVVDYLQLVTSDGRRGEGRVQEVTEITQALKALAKELSVPVVALSQLSRKVEDRDDKRPQLADLRESGSIEQDADAVIFIYREEYYLARSEPRGNGPEYEKWHDAMQACRGTAELIVGKQRHGPIGTVRVAWNPDLTKFSSLAKGIDFSTQRMPFGDDR